MRIFINRLNSLFLPKCCLAALHNIFIKKKKKLSSIIFVIILHKRGI